MLGLTGTRDVEFIWAGMRLMEWEVSGSRLIIMGVGGMLFGGITKSEYRRVIVFEFLLMIGPVGHMCITGHENLQMSQTTSKLVEFLENLEAEPELTS
jgi:hypothetical protein